MIEREKVIFAIENCLTTDGVTECRKTECPFISCRESCLEWLLRSALALLKEQEAITGETSDGYHTFNELYHHRAVLFSVIVRDHKDLAWKARKHHDGTMYDGMFIVGIETPDGQATYHYDLDPYWDVFECRELECAPEWDGHTPTQAIERIGRLRLQEPRVMTLEEARETMQTADFMYCEDKNDDTMAGGLVLGMRTDIFWDLANGEYMDFDDLGYFGKLAGEYGKSFRFWTSRPTPEQMRNTKWEGEDNG